MKTGNKFLCFLAVHVTAFFLAACVGKIRPDAGSPAAIDSSYPSAEFRACGRLWNGLGVCTLKEGESFDSVDFQIQGYFKGSIRVDGTACKVARTQSFVESELIPVSIPGRAQKDCVLSFVMSTQLPDQESNPIQVYPLKGHLLIKVVRKDDDWKGDVLKVTGRWQSKARFWVGADGDARVVLNGCGNDYDQIHKLDKGYANVSIEKAVKYKTGICTLDGAVIHPEIQDLRVSYLIAQYDKDFLPLPIPAIKITGDRMLIQADPAVTALSLDGAYIVTNEVEFRFDPKAPVHILRAVTVKGRTVIGILKKGKWTWLQ
jgi:hypothetical protein